MAKHEMVDLKRAPLKEEQAEVAADGATEPFFPVSLHISTPEVEKLGLSDFEVGEEHDLVAKVKVTAVSIDTNEDDKRASVTLTFLAAEVFSDHGEDERAKKLFG